MDSHNASKVRLAAAALVLVGAIVTTTPAKATSPARNTCVGATCRGKDPSAMGCDRDGRTISKASTYSELFNATLFIEQRYSTRCNAYWARTTYRGQIDPSIRITARLGTGAVTRVSGSGPTVWSRMWSGKLKACGTALGAANPGFVEFASVCV